MQGAPKFSKVEIHFNTQVDNLKPQNIGTKTKTLHFEDAGLMITGDYMILVLDNKADAETSANSTGHVYPLSSVVSYTTHAK